MVQDLANHVTSLINVQADNTTTRSFIKSTRQKIDLKIAQAVEV